MATTNPYAVGPERVNGVAVSPMNFLKCLAFIYPKRINVNQGSKHYTRKESDDRCIGATPQLSCAALLPLRPAFRIRPDDQAPGTSTEQILKGRLPTELFKYAIALPDNQRR